MADKVYDEAISKFFNGTLSSADTFRLALGNFTFNASHTVFSDINAGEANGTGYTAGGQNLSSVAISKPGGAGTLLKFSSNSAVWSNVTINCNAGVIYKLGANAGVSSLVTFLDLKAANGNANVVVNAGNLTIAPNGSNGWFNGVAS